MPACTRIDETDFFIFFFKAIRENVPVYKLTFYHAVKRNDNF